MIEGANESSGTGDSADEAADLHLHPHPIRFDGQLAPSDLFRCGRTAGVRPLAVQRGLWQTGGSDYYGYGRVLPPGSVRAPAGAGARLEAARREVPRILERLHV